MGIESVKGRKRANHQGRRYLLLEHDITSHLEGTIADDIKVNVDVWTSNGQVHMSVYAGRRETGVIKKMNVNVLKIVRKLEQKT